MPSGAVLGHLAFWEVVDQFSARALARELREEKREPGLVAALESLGPPIRRNCDEPGMCMTLYYSEDASTQQVYAQTGVSVKLRPDGAVCVIELFME